MKRVKESAALINITTYGSLPTILLPARQIAGGLSSIVECI